MSEANELWFKAHAVAQQCRQVLAQNRQTGVSQWDGKLYNYVFPSPKNYPFQWFWDSAFHAIALLHVDPELAKQEVRSLLQIAQPDGFIPHMILWEKDSFEEARKECNIVLASQFYTATIQPPVLARAIFRIYEATSDIQFVKDVLPATINFFNWLKQNRDPDNDNLIAIIQPDESGCDASPKYDLLMGLKEIEVLKKSMAHLFDQYRNYRDDQREMLNLDIFNWEDVMVNAIYADGLECLAALCKVAGYPEQDIRELEDRASCVVKALEEKCWDEERGVFWDLYTKDEKQAKILTFSSIFPIMLKELNRDKLARLVEEHLLNKDEFWLPYPIPSVAATEPSFDPKFSTGTIWRGPSWVNINWYIWQRLRADQAYRHIATQLAEKTITAISIGGVREFFNPYTAEGMGAPDFGWTTLVLDMIHYEGLGCDCGLP